LFAVSELALKNKEMSDKAKRTLRLSKKIRRSFVDV